MKKNLIIVLVCLLLISVVYTATVLAATDSTTTHSPFDWITGNFFVFNVFKKPASTEQINQPSVEQINKKPGKINLFAFDLYLEKKDLKKAGEALSIDEYNKLVAKYNQLASLYSSNSAYIKNQGGDVITNLQAVDFTKQDYIKYGLPTTTKGYRFVYFSLQSGSAGRIIKKADGTIWNEKSFLNSNPNVKHFEQPLDSTLQTLVGSFSNINGEFKFTDMSKMDLGQVQKKCC